MAIQFLEWDSNFFNLKIGKIDVYSVEEFDYRNNEGEIKKEKYDLVYVFGHGKMLHKINSASFELVDIMIKMEQGFDKDANYNNPYELRENYTHLELQQCYKIAEQTARVSRFYNETMVGPEKTKELYKKWIDNTINGTFNDHMFVQRLNHEIVGINLIRTDRKENLGIFSLTGVDSNLKGKGIGKNLWNQAFGFWARSSNIKLCQSNFSLNNIESFNFHLRMGFKFVKEITYIYHFRNLNQ